MKTFKFLILGLLLLSFSACRNNSVDNFLDGYEKTPSGLYYKIYAQSDREKTKMGDMLYGQFWQYWCDSLIRVSDTMIMIGSIEEPLFVGDITEGFLMMRAGDSASFILNADSIVKYWGIPKDPHFHLCDYFKMTVRITGLQPFDSTVIWKKNYDDSVTQVKIQTLLSDEQIQLQAHLRKKNISATPNNDGVYVVVLKKGNGAKVVAGKTAVFDYTGRLLDGTIWDSSDEEIAGDAGVAFPQRHYKPQEIKIGEKRWMKGLDNALIGHTVGSKLRLFMPSETVFGPLGNAFVDEFQSIILDVDLLDVK
jgi:FKBP-type peptidyl-prolyl cis-trans isomerase